MAIVSCTKARAGRNGESKSDRNRSYTVVWIVIVNSRNDGPKVVGNAPGVAGLFDPYEGYEAESDPDALCTSIKPDQDGDNWQKWKVTATFETKFSNSSNAPADNPAEDAVVRWVETEFVQEKVVKEYDGTPIKNSSGQLLSGIERDTAVYTLCFERNELAISSALFDYNNSVNSDPWKGLQPGQGLMRITVGKPEYRNGIQYHKHGYRVRVKREGWNVEPADRGTLVLDAAGNALVRPVDQFNQSMDGEVNLDGSGRQLAFGTEPIFLPQKKLYQPMPFAFLGL